MWGRGGKDLNLTSPRAKDWKYQTVEAGKIPTPRSSGVGAVNQTSTPRRLPAGSATVSSAQDIEVLGRLSTQAKVGLGLGAAVLVFVLAISGDWVRDGGPAVLMIPAILAIAVLRSGVFSAVASLYNLARFNGRVIWIEGDSLRAVDRIGGLTNLAFDKFTAVRFEPAYSYNKSKVPVLLLERPDRKPHVISVGHIDTPGAELAKRIEAFRASRSGRRHAQGNA